MTGVTTGSTFIAPAGGVHGTLGEGDAPAEPFTLGGFPHAERSGTNTSEMAWRYLIVCDIIPNTGSTLFVLMWNEGFVRRPLALDLALRIDFRSQ
jgi:hypothetical protein